MTFYRHSVRTVGLGQARRKRREQKQNRVDRCWHWFGVSVVASGIILNVVLWSEIIWERYQAKLAIPTSVHYLPHFELKEQVCMVPGYQCGPKEAEWVFQ